MPRLDGILETALYVDDLERSVAFYQTLFGFQVVSCGERLCALGVAGRQILLLCRKRASATLALGAHDGDGQLHLAFAVPGEALDAWEAWIEQRGVTIEERRTWERGGRSLYFRDPDRHLIELATPGSWFIY